MLDVLQCDLKVFRLIFLCWKREGYTGEAVEQEEKSCYGTEIVREFTYLGDRVSAGEVCDAAVTARTSCGLLCLGNVASCCTGRDFLYEKMKMRDF